MTYYYLFESLVFGFRKRNGTKIINGSSANATSNINESNKLSAIIVANDMHLVLVSSRTYCASAGTI